MTGQRDYAAEYRRRIERGAAAGLTVAEASGHQTRQASDLVVADGHAVDGSLLDPVVLGVGGEVERADVQVGEHPAVGKDDLNSVAHAATVPSSTDSYADFLAAKRARAPHAGITLDPDDLHPSLFPHQREVVRWAAERGRAAAFLDTGLGKTRIQVAWLDQIVGVVGNGLIICPLSIAQQTIEEAEALGIEITYVRSQVEAGDRLTSGLYITNYEMQQHFDPSMFDAVVLDESSILKNHTGPTRTALIERWGTVPYRLACTATPAPNDHTELANHAEFLGAMRRVDMLAAYFVHDSDTGWRLKGHAAGPMFEWMTTWAIAARRPSDITGNLADDEPYELPPLRIHAEVVPYDNAPEGQLFATSLGGVSGRAKVRKETTESRVARALELINGD